MKKLVPDYKPVFDSKFYNTLSKKELIKLVEFYKKKWEKSLKEKMDLRTNFILVNPRQDRLMRRGKTIYE